VGEVLGKLEKMVSSALQEYCAQRTPRFVLHFLSNAVDILKRHVEILIGDEDISDGELPVGFVRWGLDIIEIRIPDLGVNYAINKAMVDARASSYTKRTTIETGRGVAEARYLMLEAEADGQAVWAEALQDLDPRTRELIVTANALKEAVENAQLVLTQPNDLLGMFAGAQRLLGAGQGQNQPHPPQGGGVGHGPQGHQRHQGQRPNRGQGGGTPNPQGQGNPQPAPTPPQPGQGSQGPQSGGGHGSTP